MWGFLLYLGSRSPWVVYEKTKPKTILVEWNDQELSVRG